MLPPAPANAAASESKQKYTVATQLRGKMKAFNGGGGFVSSRKMIIISAHGSHMKGPALWQEHVW